MHACTARQANFHLSPIRDCAGGLARTCRTTCRLRFEPDDVYHCRCVEPWSHKLKLSMAPRVPEADMKVKPHGIIGQSFDGDDVGINGAVDAYATTKPGTKLTTTAMAEGAIEGEPADYFMASKYATEFKFSRFGLRAAPYRDVAALTGSKVMPAAGTGKTAGAADRVERQPHLIVEL